MEKKSYMIHVVNIRLVVCYLFNEEFTTTLQKNNSGLFCFVLNRKAYYSSYILHSNFSIYHLFLRSEVYT